jgi:four helix bundle protein
VATIKRFEDIESWKRARQLTKGVYDASKLPKFARDFGLKDQIQRAGGSFDHEQYC